MAVCVGDNFHVIQIFMCIIYYYAVEMGLCIDYFPVKPYIKRILLYNKLAIAQVANN